MNWYNIIYMTQEVHHCPSILTVTLHCLYTFFSLKLADFSTTEKTLRRRPSNPWIPAPLPISPFKIDNINPIDMSGDGASELPIYYGSKTSDGELVKRPTDSVALSSPSRAYHPRAYSPESTPIDVQHSGESAGPPGLRRRPSQQPPQRRLSAGEYDGSSSFNSTRPFIRDDVLYREDDRDYRSRRDEYERGTHPDSWERSRPPRTYRNTQYDQPRANSTKPYYEETSSVYPPERNVNGWIAGEKRRPSDDESIDGYNYDQHKKFDLKNLSPEERREVMRLPWIQWMNSDMKNRA